jgi:hypothetical protein
MGLYETHKDLRVQGPRRIYGDAGAELGYLASFRESTSTEVGIAY